MPFSVTHLSPPGITGRTPCCNKTPFELPFMDKLTLDPAAVTCDGGKKKS